MKRKPTPDDFDFDFEPEHRPNYAVIPPVNTADLGTMTLLDKLEKLIDLARGSELRDEFFLIHHELIQSVATELKLTPMQTVMLLPFISDSGNVVNKNDLIQFFGCSSIAIMRRSEDVSTLLHRRYLIRRHHFNGGQFSYSLSSNAEKALCRNQALPVIKTTGLSPRELVQFFSQLVDDTKERNLFDEEDMVDEAISLLKGNPQLAIADRIDHLHVSDNYKVMMLYYCTCLALFGREGIPLGEINSLLDTQGLEESILQGTHPFVKQGLISPMERGNLFSRDVYKLTDKARKRFLSEYEIPKRVNEDEASEHLKRSACKDIHAKSLFYTAEDQGQIDTLHKLLDDKQLQTIRKRLEQASMRKGFNCLFYGGPGTGKTETAYQLARATGRDIMQVDISSIRDKFYGETEKIVKSIFEDYAVQVKTAKRIPILLINEADAMLSVRTSVGGNNPTLEKTENAIQNILLQAMEDIDGIMIATTNLTCNLDPAFDRRFLYKVEFHQPSVEAKTHIWQSFLPSLSEADALTLASSYDFSGGQIENISRKVMVDQLLFGGEPSLSHLEELCANEQIAGRNNNSYRPIGFTA